MTAPRAFVDTTRRVLTGVALWLDDMGLAYYDANGVGYDSATDPVVFLQRMADQPDLAIGLWGYYGPERGDHEFDLNVSVFRFQVICRVGLNKSTFASDDVAESVYAGLHARERVRLPNGTNVLLSKRVVRGEAGPDDSGRPQRADSYELLLNPGDTE